MRIFKNSFIWQFAGGFLLGAAGLLAFQPAEATRTFASHFTGDASAQR
ncbi:MAG TPA: hypothetical protein VF592_14080 [Sphingomonas sp.]|jgi:hypothetical protein